MFYMLLRINIADGCFDYVIVLNVLIYTSAYKPVSSQRGEIMVSTAYSLGYKVPNIDIQEE